MSSAHVNSIQRLADFQAALNTFRDKAKSAVGSNAMELRRSQEWLESQLAFWKTEIRRAEEAVFVAKQELTRRKMMRISDRPPDTTEQEKTLRKAQARLAHAEDRRDSTKKWLIQLPDAVDEYNGYAKPFEDFVQIEMAKMLRVLEEKIAALHAYQRLQAGTGGSP
jgi:hypothetical protein